MIRHHVQKSAAAKRYYRAADYYTAGQDARPHFGGRVADRLGIAGPADPAHFDRLCDNRHPLTGEPLTPRTDADRIVGIDLTFDGPKGASVLEAFAPPEERRRLADARVRAELDTLAEMERAAATRVRGRGRDGNRTTGELLWFRVSHDTTRPVDGVPDMQPHEHYFVLNATWDPVENRYKAANLFDILRDLPYFQAAFQARHAANLQALGYEVERKGKAFEVSGIPRRVTDAFSRRQQLIERTARELGITDPEKKAELGATTREHKGTPLTADELRRHWLARLSDADRRAVADTLLAAKGRERAGVVQPPAMAAADSLDHAARHVFERKSAVPVRELLAEALAHGVGSVDVDAAWRELENRDRFTAAVDGRAFVASRAVLAEEREVIRLARDGRGTLAPLDPGWEIRDRKLNIGQRAAVHGLLGSTGFVTVVVGAAGTGKTTLLEEALDGAAAAGRRVFAFAPSAAASRNNLAAQFPGAETVAKLLASRTLQEEVRGQVLLIDEAALLGTRETAAVLRLAKNLDARVWLVGDDRQHRPVARGSPFDLLTGRAGIEPVRVTEVVRQQTAPYRTLVERARHHPAGALGLALDQGWVHELPDGERYRRLADDYLAATAGGRTALVVAPTHREGGTTTAAIRDALKAAGRLGEERVLPALVGRQLTEAERADPHALNAGDVLQFVQNAPGHRRGRRIELRDGVAAPVHLAARYQVYRPAALPVAVGDRLRVTAGGTAKTGQRLDTGDALTVAGFTKAGDVIDERGRVIGRDFGHLTHGYVTTSVSSQSRTVDHVLVAMGPASLGAISREQLYVSLSRGKHSARVYTDDLDRLARAVERSDPRVSASEVADRRRADRRRLLQNVRLRARRADATDREPAHSQRDRAAGRGYHAG